MLLPTNHLSFPTQDMAINPLTTPLYFVLLVISFVLFAILLTPGIAEKNTVILHSSNPYLKSKVWKSEGFGRGKEMSARRSMIGSIAPACTYNECKGCRFKCRAEQVPVDASDPMNSAYRYRCVCHR